MAAHSNSRQSKMLSLKSQVLLLMIFCLLAQTDAEKLFDGVLQNKHVEVPPMCLWNETDCERLKGHEQFKFNCDTKDFYDGSVYSCHESCTEPYSRYCRNHYCLGYQKHCLPTTTSTEETYTELDEAPRMCYWTDEQCKNLPTHPDFYNNCDQKNPIYDEEIYSCYVHCAKQTRWCRNDYCTHYTKHCPKETTTTAPFTTTPSPTTSPSTTEVSLDEPMQCYWSEEHCQKHQKHKDFKKNCDWMRRLPDSKPYSCLEWCKYSGPLCSGGQCADYKLACRELTETEGKQRISIWPITIIIITELAIFGCLMVMLILWWKYPQSTQVDQQYSAVPQWEDLEAAIVLHHQSKNSAQQQIAMDTIKEPINSSSPLLADSTSSEL